MSDAPTCIWTFDEVHEKFDTSCGDAHWLGEGTPWSNGMRFCCYCGKPLLGAIRTARAIEAMKGKSDE